MKGRNILGTRLEVQDAPRFRYDHIIGEAEPDGFDPSMQSAQIECRMPERATEKLWVVLSNSSGVLDESRPNAQSHPLGPTVNNVTSELPHPPKSSIGGILQALDGFTPPAINSEGANGEAEDELSGEDNMFAKAQQLKNRAMDIATGGSRDGKDFWLLRRDLCARKDLKPYLPRFLTICRNPNEFWAFIQPKFSTYRERREFLNKEFEAVLAYPEQEDRLPTHESITATLNKVDSEHVREAWQKALDRRIKEPDGAITAARTLLESVCKHVLDKAGEAYSDKEDLPGLYHQAVQRMKLAPNQQAEQSLKRILGSCQAIVQEIGVLRNKMGDAHGKGKGDMKAQSRHAELAVNLAGAMATFLIATWEDQGR